jgi:uncharacterized protein (DUF885 family)
LARPGQAVAYKIGELKILELRRYAQSKLGAKFDIKEFHRLTLESGRVSLRYLDYKIKNWANRVSKMYQKEQKSFISAQP